MINTNTIPMLFGVISVSIRCKLSLDTLLSDTALIDILIPSKIGFNKVIKVQIAAIPIVPAPIKRILEDQMLVATSPIATPAGISDIDMKYGTKPNQVTTKPNKIAKPLARPIR